MMNNIQFTPKDILEKAFTQKMRGYDPNEVDTFLDGIIKDYQEFEDNISRLSNENSQLKMEIKRLKSQGVQPSSDEPSIRPSGYFNDDNTESSNHESFSGNSSNNDVENELLKRVSNLEQRVFGTTEGPSSVDRY